MKETIKMDWSDQMESMMKTWMNTQKSMWNGFFEAMQGAGKSQSSKMWEQTLNIGEQAMENIFKAQEDWMQAWVDGLNKIEGMPEAAVAYTRQFQEMAQHWSETQKKLWANWLGSLRSFDPDKKPGSWESGMDNLYKSWQDSTRKIMETQAEWMRTWTDTTKKEKAE
jgi:hypothetical protein